MIRKNLTDSERVELRDALVAMDNVRYSIDSDIKKYNANLTEDAIPAAITSRALEYAVKKAEFITNVFTVWREVFPIDRDCQRGTKFKLYTIWDGAAIAGWYRYDGKHNSVAVGSKEISIKYDPITLSYPMEAEEMKAADYAGVDLEAKKIAKVYEGLDERVEELMFIGDATMGFTGLIEHPNITTGDLDTGAWDAYPTTTAQNIIDDTNIIVTAIVTANKGSKAFRGKKVKALLSSTYKHLVSNTVANTYTMETIETVLLRNTRFGGFIESPMHDTTAGGAGDYITFGVFEMDGCAVPLSADKERQRPTDLGMIIEYPFLTKVSALHVKQPLWFYQAEGANT